MTMTQGSPNSTIGDRLRWARRRAGYATATEAAVSRGWPVPTYAAHENGSRGLKLETARRYAEKFNVSLIWLLTGEGGQDVGKKVGLVGHAGLGCEVFPSNGDDPWFAIDDIDLPAFDADELAAIRVVGDAMYPFYKDGDIIYFKRERDLEAEVVGRECVVRLANGRMYLKRVEHGRHPGVYTLVSSNAPPLSDVALAWAARVVWIYRA